VAQIDIFRLDDRVALVAGGGGAIGSAIGAALAGAGARIVLMDLKTDPTVDVSQRIITAGGDALPVIADATSEQECEVLEYIQTWDAGRLWDALTG